MFASSRWYLEDGSRDFIPSGGEQFGDQPGPWSALRSSNDSEVDAPGEARSPGSGSVAAVQQVHSTATEIQPGPSPLRLRFVVSLI